MYDSVVTLPTRILGYNYDIQIASWRDKLMAYRAYSGDRREVIEGGIGVGFDFIERCESWDEWFAQIPSELLVNTESFPEHQYQMLWFAANSFNAEQILKSRPLILALICERYPVDNLEAMRLAKLGQREILQELGFAHTRGVLKFIDKLRLEYQRASEMNHVMKMIDPQTCYFQKFRHYTEVNFASLSLQNTHPFLTGTPLGIAMSKVNTSSRLNLTLCIEDTLRLGQALGVQDPMRRIVQIDTHEALVQLHDEWVRRRNQERMESLKPADADVPYPKHLNSSENIQQITDYYDLCREGDEMCHCIAVYHSRIAQGRYVAFRAMNPERVTIGLHIDQGKRFPYQLDQISGLKNAFPKENTREVVYGWLQQQSNEWGFNELKD